MPELTSAQVELLKQVIGRRFWTRSFVRPEVMPNESIVDRPTRDHIELSRLGYLYDRPAIGFSKAFMPTSKAWEFLDLHLRLTCSQ